MSNEFSVEDRKELLGIARKTIEHYLKNGNKPLFNDVPEKFKAKRGVFVTLHKKGNLRGCIGYPLPVSPLFNAVVDNAVSSAFEDPRFPPLEIDELKEIDIEISVLSIPEKVERPEDVRVGVDGIIISKHGYRGLLLPQVPVEQEWDLDQYISYGCMKAGLSDDEWKKGVDIEVFQAEVFGELEIE
ncbi:MAG: AmmeMemoRadiSam system protein A [Candidatus Aminicenantes bacterium]|nr:AmmeMemoRadiSam system protein A [Candidatus Aminicenantes bacterium]